MAHPRACQQGIFDLLIGICQVAQEETGAPRIKFIRISSVGNHHEIRDFLYEKMQLLRKHGIGNWKENIGTSTYHDSKSKLLIARKIHPNLTIFQLATSDDAGGFGSVGIDMLHFFTCLFQPTKLLDGKLLVALSKSLAF